MNYLALLRGINVGPTTRIAMADLRAAFTAAGYRNVTTYLNSGNVLFDVDAPLTQVQASLPAYLRQRFAGVSGVAVLPASDWLAAVTTAPAWWGQPGHTSNLATILPPQTPAELLAVLGPAPEDEQTASRGQLLLIDSAQPKLMGTRWARLPKDWVPSVTLRNANTARKLAAMIAAD